MLALRRISESSGCAESHMLAGITGAQLLPGLTGPDDIAGALLFLASDLAANITGQLLGIDHGEFPW